MTNKLHLLILATLVLASTAMLAQNEPYVESPTTNINGSMPASGPVYGTTPLTGMTGPSTTGAGPAYEPKFVPLMGSDHGDPVANGGTPNPGSSGAVMDVLGGHGRSNGCMFCHTPHGTGRLDGTREKIRNGVTTAGGPFKGQTFNYISNNYNGPQNTNLYLWSMAMTTTTYTTWDGGTVNGSASTRNSPEIHTLLCMQCHDNAMHYHAQQDGFYPESGVTAGTIDPITKNVNWGAGTLVANHPVHVKYALQDGHNWGVTINPATNKVSFKDADTNQIGDSGFYGHPARLYTDGVDAYIECTSCHNPHRQTSPAYQKKDGTYTVGAFGTTEMFVRGPYSQADGTISAGFCRSCHYSKSPEYIVHSGDPTL